jgi:hypothetical protein
MSIGQGSDSKCHTLVWTQSQLGRWGPIVHGGQPQLEARSGVSRASKECTAAMAFSDVSHQGEPEPWQVTVLGTAITVEGFEDPLPIGLGDTWAIIVDDDRDNALLDGQLDSNFVAELERIDERIGEHASHNVASPRTRASASLI